MRRSDPKRVEEVALLAEGVDRNPMRRLSSISARRVALLAEGVDRNTIMRDDSAKNRVALLAEGVGRNSSVGRSYPSPLRRPPHGGRG